jgi:hypothetical protein
MLSFSKKIPIANIIGGNYNGEIIFVNPDDNKDNSYNSDSENESSGYDDDIGNYIFLKKGKIEPLLNTQERSVSYIAGPAGSGKTTYAINLVKNYKRVFPNKPFYLFSRTDYKNDPAYSGLTPYQIMIDDDLINKPVDITKELQGGSILLFDDCNTIQDEKLKKIIDKLMADIMEIGRKLDITLVITNHLVIPNEKKVARTIMNEMQSLTFFPKSGSTQQIKYALKTYYGLSNKQINEILQIPSRWITISKRYPMYIIYDKGCFIL